MEREETFQSVISLSLENPFGLLKYENNLKVKVTIGIYDEGEIGYFEIYDDKTGGEEWYALGELWFNGNKLVEYDGVFSLPHAIESKLIEWGYKIDV